MNVGDHAFAGRVRDRQSASQLVGHNRTRHRDLALTEHIVTAGQFDAGVRGEGRCRRGDGHRARGCVLAIERALRTAQHFDPLNIDQIEGRRGRTGIIDLVNIEASARLKAVIGEVRGAAEAPYIDLGIARIVGRELHAGDHFRQLGDIRRIGLGQKLAAEHGHGCGNILNIFIAVTGGNDHLFNANTLGRRRLLRLRHTGGQ